MSGTPARDLAAYVGDSLWADACLRPLLDADRDETHGTEAFCDEPTNSHPGRPIRREQMGWPSDFHRAVVSYGRFSTAPAFGSTPPWLERWSFVVSVFARETITLEDGSTAGAGDLWALDIYDHVRRILGWVQGPNSGALPLACDGNLLVMKRVHGGDVQPLEFDNEHHYWRIASRFQWLVVARGLTSTPCHPCGTP